MMTTYMELSIGRRGAVRRIVRGEDHVGALVAGAVQAVVFLQSYRSGTDSASRRRMLIFEQGEYFFIIRK